MTKDGDGNYIPWRGELLNNTSYPLNIGDLPQSTDESLAKIGLYRVDDAPVPADKIATEWTVTDTKDGPVNTPTLEDKPPPQPTLEDRILAIEKKLGL